MGEEEESILRNTWMSIMMIGSVLGNALLIAVISRNNRMRNVTNIYNLNLSASDLLKVLIYVPVYLVYAARKSWPVAGLAGCRGINLIFFSAFGVSVLTLMLMSFERYRLIVHPTKKQLSLRRACANITAMWIVSTVFSGVGLMFVDLVPGANGQLCVWHPDGDWSLVVIITMTTLGYILPGAFFIITYALVIRKLKSDAIVKPSDQSMASRNRLRRNRKAVRILAIEVWAYIFCMAPFLGFNLKEVAEGHGFLKPFSFKSVLIYCALIFHTTVNPFVHFALNNDFRKELLCMYREGGRIFGRPGRQTQPQVTISSITGGVNDNGIKQ